MKILTANKGKVFAYKDEKGEEVILGNVLYLGKNDSGDRYYEICPPLPKEEKEEVKGE